MYPAVFAGKPQLSLLLTTLPAFIQKQMLSICFIYYIIVSREFDLPREQIDGLTGIAICVRYVPKRVHLFFMFIS